MQPVMAQYNTQCAIQYTMHNAIHSAVCIIMEIHSLDIVALSLLSHTSFWYLKLIL